jgi:hypothetical protein
MTPVLFVGGPLHGERRQMVDPPETMAATYPPEVTATAIFEPVVDVGDPHYYRRALIGDEMRGRLAAYLFRLIGSPACVGPHDEATAARAHYRTEEYGRFAGRIWEAGAIVHLCMPHSVDLWRAGAGLGLADWLRPDATNLDPLDAYDAGHSLLFQEEIIRTRGRVLRMTK